MPPPSDSDPVLIRRSLARPESFEGLVGRHADAIFRYIAARIGPVAGEDVLAETFLVAFRRRAGFDPGATSARPWLYGIAANLVLRHHDAERAWLQRSSAGARALAADERTAPEPLVEADGRLDAHGLRPALAAALLELTPGERAVLLLHALEGYSHEEIAETLAITRGAAKTRLSRARARLRHELAGGPPVSTATSNPREAGD
jgi:RNA polymerase sigma factor (sigma-70 family)